MEFSLEQREAPNLAHAWGGAILEGEDPERVSAIPIPRFEVRNGLLYRVIRKQDNVMYQLIVPNPYVSRVLYLAHSHILGGHLGRPRGRRWPGNY